MAVTGQLMKLVWGGKLFVNEQWACGLHINGASMNGKSAEDFETLLTEWIESTSNLVSSAAKLEWIKFNAIDPVTGHYVSATNSDTFDLEVAKAGVGSPTNGQAAVAVSLRTALNRGRGSHGRIYQPAGLQWCTPDSLGASSTAYAVAAAQATAVLVNGINTATGAQVVVFSKLGGIAMPVTKVVCGNILDTQRRRRSALKEVYSVSPVTIGLP